MWNKRMPAAVCLADLRASYSITLTWLLISRNLHWGHPLQFLATFTSSCCFGSWECFAAAVREGIKQQATNKTLGLAMERCHNLLWKLVLFHRLVLLEIVWLLAFILYNSMWLCSLMSSRNVQESKHVTWINLAFDSLTVGRLTWTRHVLNEIYTGEQIYIHTSGLSKNTLARLASPENHSRAPRQITWSPICRFDWSSKVKNIHNWISYGSGDLAKFFVNSRMYCIYANV